MIKTLKDSEKSGFSLWILGSLDGQMTLGSTKRPSIEAQVIMTSNNLEHEDNIGEVIFKIIKDYHYITTMDIWLELGEDDRYKGIISRAEVNDLLSQLEKQKIIKRDEEGKWMIE